MKVFKLILCFAISILLTGCNLFGSSPKDPAELYKNYSADQLYIAGTQALLEREYSRSIKYYEALDTLYPFSPHAERGDLNLIYAYYQTEDYVSTVAAANRFIRLYPRNEHADYAYYMKGLGDLNQGKLSPIQRVILINSAARDLTAVREAFFDFRDLIELYPHSRYAYDARQRMIYLRNVMAQYEIDVAEYYFQRRAFVAASNRASYVIQHYPYSIQVRPALIILIKANHALGLEGPAADAERVLHANYPDAIVAG